MKFNSFFVVGVPLTRLVRQGGYDESNIVNSRRKYKLKPETLLSYPGGDDQDCEQTVRSSTCFESVISNFCYPEGYAKIKNIAEGVCPSAVVSFNLKGSVVPHADPDSVLWCTALRVNEVLETTWLIPYLIDLDIQVEQMKGQGKSVEKINLVLQQHLSYINKTGIATKAARWSCDYFYILVTDKPCHKWSASVLRTFRELSRDEDNATALGDILTELDIPILPWARRSTNSLSLKYLKAHLDSLPASVMSKYNVLQQYADIVTEWPPPLLPCRISPMSRALIIMLHCEKNRGKAVEYIIENLLSPTLTQECIDLLTGAWVSPGFDSWRSKLSEIAIKYYAKEASEALMSKPTARQLSNLSFTDSSSNARGLPSGSQDSSPTSTESSKFEELSSSRRQIPLIGCSAGFGYNETILENCDALYSEVLISELPPSFLVWLQICMMMEQKTVVACGDIVKRGPITLLLCELIRPFSWPHPLIPVLPSSVRPMDMIDSPIPFVIGVNRLNLRKGKYRSLQDNDGLSGRSSLGAKTKCPNHSCSQCAMHQDAHSTDACTYHLVFDLLEAAKFANRELLESNATTTFDPLTCSSTSIGNNVSVNSSTPCRGIVREDESPHSTPYPNTTYSQLTMSTSSTFVRCSGTAAVSRDNMFCNIQANDKGASAINVCVCENSMKIGNVQWAAESPKDFDQVCLVVPTVSGRGRLLIPEDVMSRFDLLETEPPEESIASSSPTNMDLTPKTNYLVWSQIMLEHKHTYASDVKLMLRYNWPCEYPTGEFEPYISLNSTLVPSAFYKTAQYLSRLQSVGSVWLKHHQRQMMAIAQIMRSIDSVDSPGAFRWLEDIKDDLDMELQSLKQTVQCLSNKLALLLILLPNLFINYTVKLSYLLMTGPVRTSDSPLGARRASTSRCSAATTMRFEQSDSGCPTPWSTGAPSEVSPSPLIDLEEDLISELLFYFVLNELKTPDQSELGFKFESEAVFTASPEELEGIQRSYCDCCCCLGVGAEVFQTIKTKAVAESEACHRKSNLPDTPVKKPGQSFFSKWIGGSDKEAAADSASKSALSRQRKILRQLSAKAKAGVVPKSAIDSALVNTFPGVLDRILDEVVSHIDQFEKFESDVRENTVQNATTEEVLKKLTFLLKPFRSDQDNVIHIMGCLSQWKSYLMAHFATQMSCQYQASFKPTT